MDGYWLVDNSEGVPPDDAWLSEWERGTLARLRIARRRADWRLGRWAAKRAIAAYRGLAPRPEALAAIEVRPAPSGVPDAFFQGQPAGLALSLSHSHGVGFCALSASAGGLGCDVERIEPRSPGFLLDFFTAPEWQRVHSAPPPDRDALATLLWSAKESALKALGCGLRADTRSVVAIPESIPATPAAFWFGLTVRQAGGRIFRGWWREAGGYVFTMVADPRLQLPVAL